MQDRRVITSEALRPVLGAGLVIFGSLFFLVQVGGLGVPAVSWRYLWPLFIIVPGLLLFLGALQGGPGAAGLAVPASIVTMVGLILLYQNTTHNWHSWAYAWALIAPTAVGIGRMIQGSLAGQPTVSEQGRRLVNVGLLLFLGFAVFFELVLNISHVVDRSLGAFVLPGLLIAAGAGIIARESRRSEGSRA
jgi:hypothetical protein